MVFDLKKAATIESIFSSKLSNELFERFTVFIEQRCGIHMDQTKQNMLEGRLRKRLRQLNLPTFEAYAEHVFNPRTNATDELIHMFDVVTTNKTEFFREAVHFDYLTDAVLPEFMAVRDSVHLRTFRIWSAGCSTGEEPYTMAMVLNEFAERHPDFSYAILATDLCTRVLEKAKNGIYEQELVEAIKPEYRNKYFVSSKDRSKRLLRVASSLRETIVFRRVNFMDSKFPIKEPLHAIFCRNVMIYFDKPAKEQLIQRFADNLVPGGYLFIGHSESLAGMNVPLKSVSTAVYRK